MQPHSPSLKNMFAAIALSFAVIFGWQYFYELPRQRELAAQQAAQQSRAPAAAQPGAESQPAAPGGQSAAAGAAAPLPRAAALALSPRIRIDTPKLAGSIALKGGRIDDLVLKTYRQTVDPASPPVVLLSPAQGERAYFADQGWVGGAGVKLPDADSLWQADGEVLSPERSVTLTWDNGEGLLFSRRIAVDDEYMFTIEDRATNKSSKAAALSPYARIVRFGRPEEASQTYVLHEGPIGVLDGALQEEKYSSVRERAEEANPADPASGRFEFKSRGGWLGITDKYWLVAQVAGNDEPLAARFLYDPRFDSYQADFTAEARALPPGGEAGFQHRLFAGAKEVRTLTAYRDALAIPLFERAVDFGWFFFLTKPFFYILDFFNRLLGNFGLAILCLTILVKLAMFPLADKSYASMNRMKALQPQMLALKEAHGEDKARFQQEMMALYRREKVNPAAGCLPVIIQIPVFYALYKVLYVTIEMRHAPFFGWVRDLSMPDPTNVLNLFGLLPWEPAAYLHVPILGAVIGFLSLGVWPLILGLTMWAQFRLNPTPPDPMQARMMSVMPIIFTFMMGHFPAGLVIYWSWNNLLSIAQQKFLTRKSTKPAKAG